MCASFSRRESACLKVSPINTHASSGGKLVLFEVTEPHMMRTGFAFGLQEGWWLATNEDRLWSPCLTETAWDEALQRTGFTGVEAIFPDYDEPGLHEASTIISTAVGADEFQGSSVLPPHAIITIGEVTQQQDLGRVLRQETKTLQAAPGHLLTLKQATVGSLTSYDTYIVLLEVAHPFLSLLGEDEYAELKTLIGSSKTIIWITKDVGSSLRRPEFDMISGFARAIRSEYSQLNFVTVSLEEKTSDAQASEKIIQVLRQTTLSDLSHIEPEYRERDDMLEICRVVEANPLNQMLATKTSEKAQSSQNFGNGIPLSLTAAAPGMLDTLEFEEDTEAAHPVADDEIEIEVRATGVNFRDCLITLAQLPDSSLGSECSGVVHRVGDHVTGLRQGDRVSVSSVNAYKTFMRANAACAVRIPDAMSFVQAASLPTTALTAYHALVNVARLQESESVLIHAGAGATGQMAIQIARHLKATVFTTVGSAKKKQLVSEIYGIPNSHIFFSRDKSFALGLQQATQGRGVDVVINSLFGDGLTSSWACIAPFGRFVEIGKADILSHTRLFR